MRCAPDGEYLTIILAQHLSIWYRVSSFSPLDVHRGSVRIFITVRFVLSAEIQFLLVKYYVYFLNIAVYIDDFDII